MSFTFRPAKRQNVSMLIGLSAPSGGGKTWTAMLLAKGMSAGKRFCVIDTEAGRALHYADQHLFDHGDLTPPFTPERYAEAIMVADKADYPVIVVDSFSHEWAGDGGVLDMHDEELKRMGGGDNKSVAAWVKPKMAHKRMVQQLLQVRAHLILCFRAEPKIDIVKEGNKTVIVPKRTLTSVDGWIPISEKGLPFELTASFLLLPDEPGAPKPIKLMDAHRQFFPSGKPITEAAGVALAQWAAGGTPVAPKAASKPTEANVQSYTGLYEHTVSEKKGALMVWSVTIDGQVFSTVNEQLAIDAKKLERQRVTLTYAPTSKGGFQLLTIAPEAVVEEALR